MSRAYSSTSIMSISRLCKHVLWYFTFHFFNKRASDKRFQASHKVWLILFRGSNSSTEDMVKVLERIFLVHDPYRFCNTGGSDDVSAVINRICHALIAPNLSIAKNSFQEHFLSSSSTISFRNTTICLLDQSWSIFKNCQTINTFNVTFTSNCNES